MEEDILEITKTSVSVRGTWAKQVIREKPDFTNLKFSVKCSDGSILKYSSWEEFHEDGGEYSTEFGTYWSDVEGMQSITFYLKDFPDIKVKKSVKIQRKVSYIEEVTPKKIFYSGEEITSKNFGLKVRFLDNSISYPDSSEFTVEPSLIPNEIGGKFKCTFSYTYKGDTVSKDFDIDVNKKVYTIKALDSDFGYTKFVIGGKEVSEAYYSTPSEYPIKVIVRGVPKDSNHVFKKWLFSTGKIGIESLFTQETTIEIPVGFGGDIQVKSLWDSRVSDSFGNIYNIEDGVLKSVELSSNEVIIPGSVNTISEGVFLNKNIKNVSFPISLHTIGVSAFQGCVNLTHLEIPYSVRTIGDFAFSGCSSIESIKFNQNEAFALGKGCFKDCSSLKELDFLSLKNKFKDCVFGDGISTDVWTGCKLRVIRLTKGNFMSESIKISSDKSMTVRVPGFFRVTAVSKTDMVRARVIGNTADGTSDTISRDITLSNAWNKQFHKGFTEDSFTLKSYDHNSTYDMRFSCGCYLVGEGNTHFDVEIFGLNNPDFNYEVYVDVYAKDRFTPNGNLNFYSEGTIGQGFSNWNMEDYVNDILYPNISTESGIRLIDLMLPIYNMRQF